MLLLALPPLHWPPELRAVSSASIQGWSQHLFSGDRQGHVMLSVYLTITCTLAGAYLPSDCMTVDPFYLAALGIEPIK